MGQFDSRTRPHLVCISSKMATATPLKPWEIRGNTPSTTRPFSTVQQPRSGAATTTTSSASSNMPPSIPPRPTATGYSPSSYYGPGFGSMSYGGYGRPFGMYGSGGYGYGGMYGNSYGGGSHGGEESHFVRTAEESTRAAFQSVESVVGAFSSVSMMLESTYFAVHSCFRAVLGVAQHFTRLRNHVWGIIAAIALLRRMRSWLKKLLRVLRLRTNAERDDAWEEASLQQDSALRLAEISHTQPSGDSRVWPAVMFFAIVFGVPWLLWKLLSAILNQEGSTSSGQEDQQWEGNDGQPITARALHNFTAERNSELSFSAGDELVLAPRQLQNGWLLAGKNRTSGLIPANYVEILPASNKGSSRERGGGVSDSLGDDHVTPAQSNQRLSIQRQRLFQDEQSN